MNRKSLSIALAALALLASSAAFAAEEPAVASCQKELVSTLQAQPDAGEELPDLDGMQTPIQKHGQYCSYQGQGCKSCVLPNGSSGKRSCEIQRCYDPAAGWHNHFVNCGNCTTACPI